MNNHDIAALIGILVQIGIPILVLAGTWGIGKWIETRHFRSIVEREAANEGIVITNLKRLPEGIAAKDAFLCEGCMVVATDYFKMFMARLKNLIGGRLFTFESLLERGRREAVLRMIDDAKRRGATLVLNVRYETASITRISRGNRQKTGGVEVLVYGTAVVTK